MNKKSIMHPCYSREAKKKYSRIHLPVAKKCNLGCNYCGNCYINSGESMPGACKILRTPVEAISWLEQCLKKFPDISVTGVAGPGEPLFNEETFEVFELINNKYPDFIKCISTNGINISNSVDKLKKIKIDAITLTINSRNLETIKKIYSHVNYNSRVYYGDEMAKIILDKQEEALKIIRGWNILKKINIIYIEGINSTEIEDLVKYLKKNGIDYVNLIPLIPRYKMKDIVINKDKFERVKKNILKEVRVNSKCARCSADAVGRVCCKD